MTKETIHPETQSHDLLTESETNFAHVYEVVRSLPQLHVPDDAPTQASRPETISLQVPAAVQSELMEWVGVKDVDYIGTHVDAPKSVTRVGRPHYVIGEDPTTGVRLVVMPAVSPYNVDREKGAPDDELWIKMYDKKGLILPGKHVPEMAMYTVEKRNTIRERIRRKLGRRASVPSEHVTMGQGYYRDSSSLWTSVSELPDAMMAQYGVVQGLERLVKACEVKAP